MKHSTTSLPVTLIIALIGGMTGAAAMNYFRDDSASVASSDSGPAASEWIQRLEQLEARIADERVARLLLEQQVGIASTELPTSLVAESANLDASDQSDEAAEDLEQLLFLEQDQPDYDDPSDPAVRRRLELEAVGFNRDEIAWIEQQEADVALEGLFAQYEARRAAAAEEGNNPFRSNVRALRERLGDEYYEKFLQANGLPVSASVRTVMPGSPAQNAGLQAGDEIVAYGGERVFNFRDINSLTVQGEPGETVLIEVNRDGQQVQLTIPRGPLGVAGNRWRGRRGW